MQKRKTLEEFGREHFSPAFLKECDDEYRRAEIIGGKHDQQWADARLPGWQFFRATGGALFVGSNDELGLTAQGETESEVQKAAEEAQAIAVQAEG